MRFFSVRFHHGHGGVVADRSSAGGLGRTHSATVAAAPAFVKDVTLCLTNSCSFCADVKGSRNVSGQEVGLYNKASANHYHWIELSETCWGETAGGAGCVGFADAQNSNVGMGMNGSKNVVKIGVLLGGGAASGDEAQLMRPDDSLGAVG
jgi:hypothetical protein